MIFFFFIDGIGFGRNNKNENPFAIYSKNFFLPLADKSHTSRGVYLKTDSCLGISGLPQSATGQTALWTGINGAKILNRHVSGFPTFTLKKILQKHSIIKILNQHGFHADFINCYFPSFFRKMAENPRLPFSTSTHVQLAAKRPLKTFEDLVNQKALFMDISNQMLFEQFKDLKRKLPQESIYEKGKKFFQNFSEYDFCLFEYYLTDYAGHNQDWKEAEKVIVDLENFIEGLIDGIDKSKDQLIITSDHGNLEDLSTNKHSLNPVPTFLYGKWTDFIKNQIHSLTDITPTIYRILNISF